VKVLTPFKVGTIAVTLFLSGSALSGALSEAQLQQFGQGADTDVIIILRDQVATVPAVRGGLEARAAALAAAQVPLQAELRGAQATRVHGFQLINALSARVSKAEISRLAVHPLVAAVVPDRTLHAVKHGNDAAARSSGASAAGSATAASDGGLCNTLEPQALQLTSAGFADPSVPQAQQVRDGNGRPVTGTGVKVAFIADGLDTTVAGFTRPDGTPVFFDYEDFSGDPAGTATAGGEAFGDASSLAAQDNPNGTPLLYDISQFVNAAHPLPSPCNIRIRGMAPGASLAGLKVFSNLGLTTTSTFVQAIEWAVLQDKVDVINESFGGEPLPDNSADPISLADDAAVAAGITVVVSSGDAGTYGSIESPSSDPAVIAAGATTQYRFYAQTGSGVIPLLNPPAYLNNNISPFSSGGFSQAHARTVDVVAPGDLSWALCSTNATLYTDCVSYAETTTPIEDFGGTSEASPLTAGEAALVIQAYRSTHGGATPPPSLVKTIIMSTATDLGAPSSEQGAGLINALGAVNAALSVGGAPLQGHSVLHYPTAVSATDPPGTWETRTFVVTNYGTTSQQLAPALQTLGPAIAGGTQTVMLNPASDPTFPNVTGSPRAYVSTTFTVPAGAQHLDAAIAFQTPAASSATPIVYISLVDPHGRLATYSNPQGFGQGYAHVDVVKPAAGVWTAYLYTRIPTLAATYTGPVIFNWAAERYVELGSVSPAWLALAPGASAQLTARFAMPANAGDLAAAIRFAQNGSGPAQSEIPVTLRTLVPIGSNGGSFSGQLAGGNGRAGFGPFQTFAFDIPYGARNLSLSLPVSDTGYLLEGLLVDPNGMQLSVAPNVNPSDSAVVPGLQTFRYDPQPGRWKFILLQNYTSSGNQVTLPFTGTIGFYSNAQVASASLPNNPFASLSASAGAVSFPIQVTNNGTQTQWYFTDARLRTPAVVSLGTGPACASPTLQGACGFTWVPPETSAVQFVAQSTSPINMDVYNDVGYNVGATGSPDLWARPAGTDTVAATLFVPEVPYGPWILVPSLIGPYGPGGASTTTPVTTGAAALMKPFDAAVASSSGNVWADLVTGSNTFNPLVLAPGQSGTITVTITPNAAQVGSTVSGYVYIDTYNETVSSGDEVVRLPYIYTVAP
jgi:hypothetical protein